MKKYNDNEKVFKNIGICSRDDTISAQEATGLIPSIAKNDYEMDSYKEIYEFTEKPITKPGKNNSSQHGL